MAFFQGLISLCQKYQDQVQFVKPINEAIVHNHLQIVKLLVQASDLQDLTQLSFSPLDCAAFEGQLEIMRFLAGIFPPEALTKQGDLGFSPLNYAVDQHHYKMVQFLAQAMPQSQLMANSNPSGRSVLHQAADLGDAETVGILIKFIPAQDLAQPDSIGFSALHCAVNYNNVEIVKVLLENMTLEGINAQDLDGKTALDLAERQQHLEIVKMLKKHTKKTKPKSFIEKWFKKKPAKIKKI